MFDYFLGTFRVRNQISLPIHSDISKLSKLQFWPVYSTKKSQRMTKSTKWHVRTAKTQISLGIRPGWSESSLSAPWVAKDPDFLHADSEDWSDWVYAQSDMTSLGAHAILLVMSLMRTNSTGDVLEEPQSRTQPPTNDTNRKSKQTKTASQKHAYIIDPHFYIVQLGFTGVYIIFLFLLENIDYGYSLEPPRRGGSNEYPKSMFWAELWNISQLFIWDFR